MVWCGVPGCGVVCRGVVGEVGDSGYCRCLTYVPKLVSVWLYFL